MDIDQEIGQVVASGFLDELEKIAFVVKPVIPEGEGLEKTAAITSDAYTPYFKNKMKTRGITSLKQLTPEQKKKFFNSVDTGYHSSREKFEGLQP